MNGVESTVCFFRDLHKTLQALPDVDAGILMKALFAHANGDEPALEGSPIAQVLFIGISDQMDRLDAYRRSKSRGGANRSKQEQTGANGCKPEHNGAPYTYPFPYPNPVYKTRAREKKDERGIDYEAAAREIFVKEAQCGSTETKRSSTTA